ncbi:MAG: IS1595 family transposase [Candidatus Korobacteraceae bacterium]
MKPPQTLQEAILFFSNPENCREFMVTIRWLDGKVRCPRCNSKRVTYLNNARVYKCNEKHDRQKFSLKVGTVMEDSAIPLEKWLPAVWLLANDKNGISSYELHRTLGVTQKSAWFMLHRIRTAMRTKTFEKLGSGGGPVEIDETFVGGQKKFMHGDRKLRLEQNGWMSNRTVVMGFLDRDLRQVRAKIVPNIKREVLQNEVLNEIAYGSKVYSDQAVGYDNLHKTFVHEVVDKVESYVNGQVHVNSLENFWSLLKRGLKGTYIAVEPFHLQRYVDEQIFRYNNRATKDNPLNDSDRFMLALSQIVGCRLTYSELTGKVGETSF